MGSYRRRGHWRRGRDGQRHWVSAHYVKRGSGYSASKRTTAFPAFRRQAALSQPPSIWRSSDRWVNPNARCPVCGALTYFYTNEHGSKVYFDELGPPWPKHPCLDTAGVAESRLPHPTAATSFAPHQIAPIPNTTDYRPPGRMSSAQATGVPGRVSYPWLLDGPWTVVGRWVLSGRVILHMHPLRQRESVSAWQTPFSVMLKPGDLVFLRDGWISYFDLNRFEAVTSPVAFIASLSRPESPIRRFFRRLITGGQ